MGGQKYLIDTNVAIEYLGESIPDSVLNKLDEIFDGHFYISVINKIELLGFAGITNNEELKFKELIKASNVLGLSDEVVNRTIAIRKQHKIKLPDAIIIATAFENQLILITQNTKDFNKIEGVKILNPFDL
jgi:hypothetical protein